MRTGRKREIKSSELQRSKAQLFCQWKQDWRAKKQPKQLVLFFSLFVDTYEYAIVSEKINKTKNMRWKQAFVVVLIIEFFVSLGVLILLLIRGENKENILYGSSLLILLFFLLGSIISKWLDVKKYQETWVRHSDHVHKMESEMLKFVCNMKPYAGADKRVVFAKNIIKIWNKNQNKFVRNMEEKEKGLLDIFRKLKL